MIIFSDLFQIQTEYFQRYYLLNNLNYRKIMDKTNENNYRR